MIRSSKSLLVIIGGMLFLTHCLTAKKKHMFIKDTDAITRDGGNIVIKNYITKSISESFSLATAKLNGDHPITMSELSDRAYYILKGKAVVTIDNEQQELKAGDVALIPRNTPHSISGDVEYIVINAPSFDPAYERKTD